MGTFLSNWLGFDSSFFKLVTLDTGLKAWNKLAFDIKERKMGYG